MDDFHYNETVDSNQNRCDASASNEQMVHAGQQKGKG